MGKHQPEGRISHRLRQGPAISSFPAGGGRNLLGIVSESVRASSLGLWRREAHQLVANSIPAKGTPWSVEAPVLEESQGQAGRSPRLR